MHTDYKGRVVMRLSASHRKAAQIRELPGVEWGYSHKRNWYYFVPPEQVDAARRIGLTVSKG